MSRKVIEAVEQLAEPILAGEGLELYDTEYVKEGKNWYLRVYIDRPGGKVDLDDCSRVSERLGEELDRVDPVSGQYFLEVSSPGAERPLKKPSHFERVVGERVFLTTYEAIEGRKKFEGILTDYSPEKLTVDLDGEQVEIPMEKVAKARLVLVF
ncbi:MAG: ribosome maturation factor RimP [Firmicutes bacterium]|uniref:Ribosome maturation factor RimP n=1 Tax=Melghirimyces thermohalophilus TaxID=1236220 RepID=A0A1G6J0A1_9BACL|nr:ribosome maturation factor RimP [Melghirimyces thermohalophilus]MDA8352380.1 ribosome maturation factor RimP [Bacillota bacterium]SDC12242.1 ribosome maturation factor RimP [Melghirimyces thermohalophilus]